MKNYCIVKLRFYLSWWTLVFTAFTYNISQSQNPPAFQSDDLSIIPINDRLYIHQSYLNTDDFGKVGCNGLVFVSNGEALVLDTPVDDKSSINLISWITDSLNASVKLIVPTHFHNDCLGGLEEFHQRDIQSVAHVKTLSLAAENNLPVPASGFQKDTTVMIGSEKVRLYHPGEGHTVDNVIGYIESEQAIFGGCLIKADGAGKGYLGDANIKAWPSSVNNLKVEFPKARVIVPGHGNYGGPELLGYTARLFQH